MSRIQLPRLSRIAIAAAASAALIGTTFIAPATSFAAPTSTNAVAASSDAATQAANVIYTDPTGSISGTTSKITGGTYTHLTQLAASNSANGDLTAVSDSAGTGNSILEPDSLKLLQVHGEYTNNTANPIKVDQLLILPKYYGGTTAPLVDPSAFDANGLKSSYTNLSGATLLYAQSGGNTKPYSELTAAGYGPADVLEIQISGTLAAGATWSLDVPLQLPAASAAGTSFQFGEAVTAPGLFILVDSQVRFAMPLTGPDGSSLVPFKGAFLATVQSKGSDGKSVYTTVPELQQYMPEATANTNYWVNNFKVPSRSDASQPVLYPGGYYVVDAAKIGAAVKTHGYAQELDSSGNPMTSYTYQMQTTKPTIVDPDGNPVGLTADRTAPYVGLRPVVTGTDTSVELGDDFDPKTNKDLNLKVFDHNGKAVDLSSSDVTISGSVDTAKAGTYPVTVTYTPDGVSNTFNVTVKALSATPVAPTQSGDTVTIPTVTGVDYQVDGKTVTGTITVPDGQTITVTAVPQANYAFTEGATTSWDFSYNVPTTPTPTPGESGSATPGEGAGGQAGSQAGSGQGGNGQSGTGSEVKTSGTGSAADLAGLGIALAAAGTGAAAAARKIRRNRH